MPVRARRVLRAQHVCLADIEPRRLTQRLVTAHPERLRYVFYAFQKGMSVREVARLTTMDPWFLYQVKQIVDEQQQAATASPDSIDAHQLRIAKRMGISDDLLASSWKLDGKDATARVPEPKSHGQRHEAGCGDQHGLNDCHAGEGDQRSRQGRGEAEIAS